MPWGEEGRSPPVRLCPPWCLHALSPLFGHGAWVGVVRSCPTRKPQPCSWEGTGHPTGAAAFGTRRAFSEVTASPINIYCQAIRLRSGF